MEHQIDDTEFVVENVTPNDIQRNRARNRGQVIEHLKDLCALNVAHAQQSRKAQPQKHADGNAQKKNRRVPHRIPKIGREQLVRKQIDVIFQPRPRGRARQRVVILKAVHEREQHRGDRKDQKPENGRQNEEKRDQMLSSFEAALPLYGRTRRFRRSGYPFGAFFNRIFHTVLLNRGSRAFRPKPLGRSWNTRRRWFPPSLPPSKAPACRYIP